MDRTGTGTNVTANTPINTASRYAVGRLSGEAVWLEGCCLARRIMVSAPNAAIDGQTVEILPSTTRTAIVAQLTTVAVREPNAA